MQDPAENHFISTLWKIAQCNIHIVETINVSSKISFNYLTVYVLLANILVSILCVEFFIQVTLYLVEHKMFYFQFVEKFKLFSPHNAKSMVCFPLCGKYHKVLSILRKQSASLPQNYLKYLH